jgi:hypothetical protein
MEHTMWTNFSLHIQPASLAWKQRHTVVESAHGIYGIDFGAAAETSDADYTSIEPERAMKVLLLLKSKTPKLLSAYCLGCFVVAQRLVEVQDQFNSHRIMIAANAT